MSAGNGPADAAATFCDLLNDVSRLQREMGSDMVAWAKAYEAAGQAMQKNAETLALMAQVGRHGRIGGTGPICTLRGSLGNRDARRRWRNRR